MQLSHVMQSCLQCSLVQAYVFPPVVQVKQRLDLWSTVLTTVPSLTSNLSNVFCLFKFLLSPKD